MRKIRFHPLFLVFVLFMIVREKVLLLAWTLLSVLCHEGGHCVCARKKGYFLKNFSLMPYGAVMYAEDGLPDGDGTIIALAGPLVNLSIAVFLSALWWFFPELHRATEDFFRANLSIGLYNLLPCYPLDGGRICLGLFKNKKTTLTVMRILGYCLCGTCAVLFVLSCLSTPVWWLALSSVMFFLGATVDGKKEKYRLLCNGIYFLHPDTVLEEKTYYATADTKIADVVKLFDASAMYRLHILDKNGKSLATLEGNDLEKLFFFSRKRTLAEFLSSESHRI